MPERNPGGPAQPTVAPPSTGWPCAAAPNGRLLGFALGGLDESPLVGAGDGARIYALGAGPFDYDPSRLPLLLIHGIQGSPSDLQAVVNRFRGSRYQLHVICYDSEHRRTSLNGDDVASELRALQKSRGDAPALTVFAHSLGGIVARQALNQLALGGGAEQFHAIRVLAIDTPWHGFSGPADTGVQGVFMSVARLFLPNGLDDMRALSAMFQGEPSSPDPTARPGLLDVSLPDNLTVALVFAQQGDDILDYTEGCLAVLPALLVSHFCDDVPVRGEPRLMNFWKALLSSEQYDGFAEEMRSLADANKLERSVALSVLGRHYPRFPGDHSGVLQEHSGGHGLLDWLERRYRSVP
jgi:hypothetical protein